MCILKDFRSNGGIYDLAKSRFPQVVKNGQDLFSVSLLSDPTASPIFLQFFAEFKSMIDAVQPGPTHHFIKALESQKKLLRCYSQNIDGLDEKAGISNLSADTHSPDLQKLKTVKLVSLHGVSRLGTHYLPSGS